MWKLRNKKDKNWGKEGKIKLDKKREGRRAWVDQLVKCPTAQVMVLRFVCSSPTSDSVLTAGFWSLLKILCLPLSLSLPCSCSVSLFLSKINKH